LNGIITGDCFKKQGENSGRIQGPEAGGQGSGVGKEKWKEKRGKREKSARQRIHRKKKRLRRGGAPPPVFEKLFPHSRKKAYILTSSPNLRSGMELEEKRLPILSFSQVPGTAQRYQCNYSPYR
jgi:hypothetical protein